MPSLLGHAVAGLAITAGFRRDRLPRRTWALAAVCAMAPDLDWFVGFMKVHRGHVLNHRGVAHSLLAALIIAAGVYLLGYRSDQRRGRIWLCLTLAALSHGLLDACTLGGVGVALFMPFSDSRWVCIWQPMNVAPLPLGREHTFRFLATLWTETFWIGWPALAVAGYARLIKLTGHGGGAEAFPEPGFLGDQA